MISAKRFPVFAALPFLLPSLAGFVLFSFGPMVVSLLVSVSNWDALHELTLFSHPSAFFAEYFAGFENYKKLFTSAEFYQALKNTLRFMLFYIPLILPFSIAASLILTRGGRAGAVFRVICYIPVITSWVAGALIWRWVLSPEYGILNSLLALIGVKGPAWLQSETWAMPGIVLASVWKDTGYFALMFFSGLIGIDKSCYEAADLDGANAPRKFFHITLPLLTPTLFFVLIIILISSFQLFPQVVIMTPDGGPGGSTYVMVERIYVHAFRYYEMGYAAAMSWILFIIIFTFTAVQMKLQNRWVNYDR
ncbi:MAG: sugar ABC transporter permease [Treponema sp.]|jgi:multiple sugar transport system permease protein|nr:sugar ABC transporter permease [Treponema sp.]